MFGKIKFGFNNQSGSQQKNVNSQSISENSIQTNPLKKKSFLTNPKFNYLPSKNSSHGNNNNKRQQSGQIPEKHEQKTKQIKKQTTQGFSKNAQKNNSKNSTKANNISSIQNQMQGSKFRILNEILYTSSSQEAMKHFKDNPQDYQTYHEGYRYQSQKWQSKPVNVIIKFLRKSFKSYKDKIICDLGCGQGFLYEGLTQAAYEKTNQQGKAIEVKNKHIFNGKLILSFDLVSMKPFINVADIKNLPLQKNSVDVVIFCLSLMGRNYLEFIREALRVLKQNTGQLIIAEVESRSRNWKLFCDMIEMLGFELINNGVSLGSSVEYGQNQSKRIVQNTGRYFRILHFTKKNSNENHGVKKLRFEQKSYTMQSLDDLSQLLLTECIYKKR